MVVDFGVFLSPEVYPYSRLRFMAEKTKELGYHSIWVSDHLHGMYESQAAHKYEYWTLETALATLTERMKFG